MIAGVFSFVTIVPVILKSSFGLESSTLAYGTTLFFISYAVGNLFYTNKIDKSPNLVNSIIFLYCFEIIFIIGLLVAMVFSSGYMEFEYLEEIYFISRISNGFTGGGIVTIIRHVIKLKLINTKNRTKVNSVIDSFYSLLKYFMPIIGGFAADLFSPIAPIIIGLSLFVYSFYVIIFHKAKIYFQFAFNVNKEIKRNKNKILDGFKKYFHKDKYRPVRIHYIVNGFFFNSIRPFFDFFIPILLVSSYSYKISEISIIIGWRIIGMVFQFATSAAIEKIPTGWFQLISHVITGSCLIILATNDGIYLDVTMLSFVMFIAGFAAGMVSNWEYKIINRILRDGIKVNHTVLIGGLLGGSGLYVYQFILGILYSLNGGTEYIKYFMIIASITLFAIGCLEVIMDKRFRDQNLIGND